MRCHALPCAAMRCHALPCAAMRCHAVPCGQRFPESVRSIYSLLAFQGFTSTAKLLVILTLDFHKSTTYCSGTKRYCLAQTVLSENRELERYHMIP
jgi:hypothetical protein